MKKLFVWIKFKRLEEYLKAKTRIYNSYTWKKIKSLSKIELKHFNQQLNREKEWEISHLLS